MTNPMIERWHELISAGDSSGIGELLADEVVFYSPVMHSPQRGKKIVTLYLVAAFHVLCNPGFRYIRQIIGPSDAMLEFETEIDGVLVNGVDIIQWNNLHQITEFKVMLRPLKAITVVRERISAMLELRNATAGA